MNKSYERPKTLTKNIKRSLAVGALSLTASVAGVSPASAETKPVKSSEHITTRQIHRLERETEADLQAQRPVTFFTGVLIRDTSTHTGGANYYNASKVGGGEAYPDDMALNHNATGYPLVVFAGSPKDRFGHNDLTSGDFLFGSIDRTSRQPHVTLRRFNQQSMKLVGDMSQPFALESVIFAKDELGELNYDQPLTAFDDKAAAHGGPLTDANGNPLQIAQDYQPKG